MARKRATEHGYKKMIAVRLTEADFASYEAKVKESGMSTSEFFRNCVLANKTIVVACPVVSEVKPQALYVVNLVASDIRDLARIFKNEFAQKRISEEVYFGLLLRLDAVIRELLKEVESC